MAAKNRGKRQRRRPVAGLEFHQGKYRWRPMIAGVRHTIQLASTTEALAVQEVKELQRKNAIPKIGTWSGGVSRYLFNSGLAENTRTSRGPVLLSIGKELGLVSPRALTPRIAAKWWKDTQARTDITAGTAIHYLRDLKQFIRWAISQHLMSIDPLAEIQIPRQQEKLRDVWVKAPQVAELLAAAQEEGDRDMEFILALGFECSMRRGEIDACRPEWFDLKLGIVTIPPTDRKDLADKDAGEWNRKGREGRAREAVIPLSDVMLELIARHGLPAPFLIAPKKKWGSNRYRFEFKKRFKKFMDAHGLGHVTVHDMRRSFASNRVSAGVSIEKVANWMGINIKTAWKRYSRFRPADSDINKGSATTGTTTAPTAPADPPGPADLQKRLATLEGIFAAGLITPEERQAKREEILRAI